MELSSQFLGLSYYLGFSEHGFFYALLRSLDSGVYIPILRTTLSIVLYTMRLSLTLLSLFTLLVGAQDTSIRDVRRAFADANVSISVTFRLLKSMAYVRSGYQIPEDLSINFEPTALLQVTFPQRGSDPITLHAGVQLRRDCMLNSP